MSDLQGALLRGGIIGLLEAALDLTRADGVGVIEVAARDWKHDHTADLRIKFAFLETSDE